MAFLDREKTGARGFITAAKTAEARRRRWCGSALSTDPVRAGRPSTARRHTASQGLHPRVCLADTAPDPADHDSPATVRQALNWLTEAAKPLVAT